MKCVILLAIHAFKVFDEFVISFLVTISTIDEKSFCVFHCLININLIIIKDIQTKQNIRTNMKLKHFVLKLKISFHFC